MDRKAVLPAFVTGLVLVGVAALMSGCSAMAPDIQALGQDPATLSIHQTIQGPGWSIMTDVSRANTPGTVASAGSNGTTAGKPSNTP